MLTNQDRADVIAKFQRSENDTGSPEVQVALLTARINDLQPHFKAHKACLLYTSPSPRDS